MKHDKKRGKLRLVTLFTLEAYRKKGGTNFRKNCWIFVLPIFSKHIFCIGSYFLYCLFIYLFLMRHRSIISLVL
ncbi:unnamed protein product [Acanthoscelides obtectus]|uniref:Uncharacterized protein n=1 Tax=Acanthoscelides obtectus TaxID=200917 RepID=A0A9P0K7T5_ACAOB|nr:unnamed protein product [Acanthoscelides obtectus]CAK1632350.1 hypothetical protein AOBTE_LOCUS7495 [Acanthoscelides obtectus]